MKTRRHPNLAQLLMATREAALRPFRPILQTYGLTGQQWRVMRALDDAPRGLSSAEIAQACHILPPSLSQILTGMESNGWVKRERSAVDLRKHTVTLTEAAQSLVYEIEPLINLQYDLIERKVGKALLRETVDAIERLRIALESGVPGALDSQGAITAEKQSRTQRRR